MRFIIPDCFKLCKAPDGEQNKARFKARVVALEKKWAAYQQRKAKRFSLLKKPPAYVLYRTYPDFDPFLDRAQAASAFSQLFYRHVNPADVCIGQIQQGCRTFLIYALQNWAFLFDGNAFVQNKAFLVRLVSQSPIKASQQIRLVAQYRSRGLLFSRFTLQVADNGQLFVCKAVAYVRRETSGFLPHKKKLQAPVLLETFKQNFCSAKA